MSQEHTLEEQLQFLERNYKTLLKQAVKDLKQVEKQTDATQKEQQVQQVITNIEFALEEMKPELAKLRANLSDEAQSSVLFFVPDLPQHSLLEMDAFNSAKAKLQAKGTEAQFSPLLIEAPCGMGKSLLATRLAHDPDIQALYPDGIFWLGLGEAPHLFQHYTDIAQALGKTIHGFVDLEIATEYMQDLFAARTSLFILDDVSDLEAVVAISSLGVNCRLLITTVESNFFDFIKYKAKQAIHFKLPALSPQNAAQLVINNAGCETPPAELDAITLTCQYNPLALQLVASQAALQKPTDWEYLLERLQEEDWEFPDDYNYHLMMALHLYIETLGDQGECYLVLAVFEDYTWIPLHIIQMLWLHMFNQPAADSQKLIEQFAETGLLHLHHHSKGDYISLHAFQQAYIKDNSDLDKLHIHMLSAYGRQAQQGWISGPDDGYFYQNLCLHLAGAGRSKELKSLLLDFDWMYKKMRYTSVHSAVADYDLLDNDEALELIQRALYDAATTLMKDPEHLATELLDHLWEKDNRDIQAMLNQAKESVPAWEPPMPSDDL